MKNIKVIIVTNLKKFRQRLKMTQEKAAQKAKIALPYWKRLEMRSQKDLPSLPMLFKIAYALRTTASRLLYVTTLPTGRKNSST